MRESFVVEKGTGEVISELRDGDRILRKESLDYLSDYETWNLNDFFKGYAGELRKVLPALSMAEKAVFVSIIPYVSYRACNLQYSNGEDMNFEDIIKVSNVARATGLSAVTRLIEKDILYKGKNSKGNQYFVNPWLVCKGNTINKVLKEMFKNYHIQIMGGAQWKDVK
jgi:hypothetical protein